MKQLLLSVFTVLFLTVGTVWADTLEDGFAAHTQGDFTEVVKWFRLAAAQGVAQDYVRAHMWLNLSAASGKTDALNNRDLTAKKRTSQQIAEAQIMARDCQQKNFKGCD
ncbi:MAG: hypothetical protein Q7S71_02845 [Candidatus Nitrotoga sp.]|nr:hypothetical protein [Candidatus Nitrotoga sp.]